MRNERLLGRLCFVQASKPIHLAPARAIAWPHHPLFNRAKLVELIDSSESTRDLVARFAAQTGDSRDAPHNFANRAVVRDLARALGVDASHTDAWPAVPAPRIRTAAADLFRASTALLVTRGAPTVARVLD